MDAQRFRGAVAHNVITHFAAWGLNSVVNLTFRYSKAFRDNLKVIDEGFHLRLHLLAVRQHDLWGFSFGRPGRHAFQRLFGDLTRLAQLFYPADITRPDIAFFGDRDFEFEVLITAVRHVTPDIKINAAGTKGWARQANGKRIFCIDFGHILQAIDEDAVAGKQVFVFVNLLRKAVEELLYFFKEAKRRIERQPADAEV